MGLVGLVWVAQWAGCELAAGLQAPIEGPGEIRIPGGTFVMGGPAGDPWSDPDEVRHEVTVSAFWLQRTEVTQRQWQAVMGENPSVFTDCGEDCPVDSIRWFDAVAYANALSEQEGLRPAYTIEGHEVAWDRSAPGYRLPTEAEWEWASLGGEPVRFAGSDDPYAVGWLYRNAGSESHRVCTRQVNGYGLCDMTGNILEWVWNWNGDYPVGPGIEGPVTDPLGPEEGTYRAVRGGSWDDIARVSRNANRYSAVPWVRGPSLGLRLARSVAKAE